jgi:hypothetical protein
MRSRLLCLFFALLGLPGLATAQEPRPLDWYLPDGVAYDPDFPTPSSVLGWTPGTWHVSHDLLVKWYEAVAAASERVTLTRYARSHEDRPLLLAAVTHPDNHARLEALREAHVEAALTGADRHEGPEVVWMGYSVHGNEASGGNAALLLAYHLAAATGPEIDAYLRDTIVLIDPCINPDGFNRFASWVNSHAGKQWVPENGTREHDEAWPGGRTNHYWFDLNRDWLLLTHPESRGRIEQFHRWMPQVVTDFHEMGTDSTYFFQPGIPSRRNPLTPEQNVRLTERIAEFHAERLDAIGSLYYTEESFDDFYYGKGSTYPDLHGAVGILFEQASSRGFYQDNSFGGIDFPFTVRNQFVTSLSTLEAVGEIRDDLSSWQREFYSTASDAAAEGGVVAYVFGEERDDPAQVRALAELLVRHGIEVHQGWGEVGVANAEGARKFGREGSFLVLVDQPQARLVRALFETRISWDDNTFYDVSSWHMPSSFGVDYAPLTAVLTPDLVEKLEQRAPLTLDELGARTPISRPMDAREVAWTLDWSQYHAPAALARLQCEGVRARVTTKPMTTRVAGTDTDQDLGTVIVPVGTQDMGRREVRALIAEIESELGVTFGMVGSGLTPSGVDLGSGSVRAIPTVRPLVVVGDGVSSYESGEVWHYLDARLGLAAALVEKSALGRIELHEYSHLCLVSGASSGWSESTTDRVRDWVRRGGVIVATKSSARWGSEDFLGELLDEDDEGDEDDGEEESAEEPVRYADYEDLAAVDRIAGTIFEAAIDPTHPLCFGFPRETVRVFKNSTAALPEGEDPFAQPARYTDSPLVAGYASDENVDEIAGSVAIRAERVGSGAVVCLLDDPLFRGVWRGTERFYANALFFASALKSTRRLDEAEEEALDGHGHQH